jgi:hypothetical protein
LQLLFFVDAIVSTCSRYYEAVLMHFTNTYTVPANVESILQNLAMTHSNNTAYPWYSNTAHQNVYG